MVLCGIQVFTKFVKKHLFLGNFEHPIIASLWPAANEFLSFLMKSFSNLRFDWIEGITKFMIYFAFLKSRRKNENEYSLVKNNEEYEEVGDRDSSQPFNKSKMISIRSMKI